MSKVCRERKIREKVQNKNCTIANAKTDNE